jgi:hypothetical protein
MKIQSLRDFEVPTAPIPSPLSRFQVLATIRRAQALCAMTEIRLDFARATVHEKLRSTIKMMKLLKWNAPILHQHVRAGHYRGRDGGKRWTSSLGIEGSVSRKMYQEWSVRLPQEFGFTGRNRRPPLDTRERLYFLLQFHNLFSLRPAPREGGSQTPQWVSSRAGCEKAHSLALDMAEGNQADPLGILSRHGEKRKQV